MINKIIKFFFLKKILQKPKKKKILIFDSVGSDLLVPYIKNKNFEILNIRFGDKKQKINLYIILKMLLKFKLSFLEYLKIYISYVEPKIIISLIDNNIIFYKLKNIYPKAKTVIIQNAWRGIKTDIFENLKSLKKNKKYKCDYILSFNKKIGHLYNSFSGGRVIPIGSIRSNNYKIIKSKKIINYLYISIFRYGNLLKSEDEVLFSSINKFFFDTKKVLHILGCSIKYCDEERNFYKKHFKDIKIIFIPKTKKRKTYHIIDKSKLIISLESTLAYEALSRGNKVLFFSLRTNEIPFNGEVFGWPFKVKLNGEFWTTRSDVQVLKEKIKFLESLNQKRHRILLEKNVKNFIKFDYKNKILSNLVNKLVI